MKSMTGCGYARIQGEKAIVTVEVKSVNSRYLDFSCKMPRAYSRLEDKIKTFAGNYTTRGKLDVYITVEPVPGETETLSLDENTLAGYLQCLERLKNEYGLKDDISVMSVAANRDIFVNAKPDDDTDTLWNRLLPALTASFEDFAGMKKAEGDRLAADILTKIDTLAKLVAEIEKLTPAVVEDYRKRLTERIGEYLGGLEIDEARIIEEVAVFADRVAVDEEMVRLHSHIEQFRSMVSDQSDQPTGRKLDFLLQEINREINTTGSKCSSAAIASLVVEAKSEAEKIREQIQNIE